MTYFVICRLDVVMKSPLKDIQTIFMMFLKGFLRGLLITND